MAKNQILNPNGIIGKTILNIETKGDFEFMFFTDNTWCLRVEGYFIGEEFFSPDYSDYSYVKSNDWSNIFIESRISPKSREDIKLNDLGEKLVNLGEISKDEIIDNWIEETRHRLECGLFVAVTNRDMALQINHDELVKTAEEKLNNFNNIFSND